MNTKILKAYMDSCIRFGWIPTFEGLKAYKEQTNKGLRELWAS
ncbi:hypothetical protein [Aminipila luticellarii]|nr:hypothetical protein [Aminipila luticellarii]